MAVSVRSRCAGGGGGNNAVFIIADMVVNNKIYF